MDLLSQQEYQVLNGLRHGCAFVGATERGMAKVLEDRSLVETWLTEFGFLAWGITEQGRDLLERREGKTMTPA